MPRRINNPGASHGREKKHDCVCKWCNVPFLGFSEASNHCGAKECAKAKDRDQKARRAEKVRDAKNASVKDGGG